MSTVIDCRPTAAAPDLAAIKARQQLAWSSGDYAVVGTTLQIVGEQLAEAMDLRAGQDVLDVAAGNGNFTLAAARRWCNVTSTDYVEPLLERGRLRAEAEGVAVTFRKADAENLPFADRSFDAVASTFGAMFSPDQGRTAGEMLRVCRPGGRIGLANWTPDGFIGQMFKIIGKHLPPPPGLKSPALWGTPEWIDTSFAAEASSLIAQSRHFTFRYRSVQHFLGTFRTFYGPMLKAFEALGATARIALAQDLTGLIGHFNKSGDATVVVPSEYLEVVVTRR
ncbi:Methyltransferase type 11 [Methylobacterium sp. 4-46]|uniref:class I SAM-dependent methyltransferase n=1 Tax=unclassified Methylobacterium TaxID=2615210 RepID=UPI000152D118|nr:MULTISPECIES: class I SAM-dependent methyltransferase [Methylobacterium]ACA17213.1 Methyltransferase type 11 [Methylobacterium sp. 4-46]WFT82895.1 class I SAM-dependent methyltransferase [Methylobacterium nodulans]